MPTVRLVPGRHPFASLSVQGGYACELTMPSGEDNDDGNGKGKMGANGIEDVCERCDTTSSCSLFVDESTVSLSDDLIHSFTHPPQKKDTIYYQICRPPPLWVRCCPPALPQRHPPTMTTTTRLFFKQLPWPFRPTRPWSPPRLDWASPQ